MSHQDEPIRIPVTDIFDLHTTPVVLAAPLDKSS
jgi:hypothetical protein